MNGHVLRLLEPGVVIDRRSETEVVGEISRKMRAGGLPHDVADAPPAEPVWFRPADPTAAEPESTADELDPGGIRQIGSGSASATGVARRMGPEWCGLFGSRRDVARVQRRRPVSGGNR